MMVLSQYRSMTTNYSNIAKLLSRHSLVLASGSPRRVYLLNEAGIRFRQVVPEINESNNHDWPPHEVATHLAIMKARAVRKELAANEIALGCDTIVILENRVLGKPSSKEDAFQMLSTLSGKKHVVCSAMSLLPFSGDSADGYELTDVFFNRVTPADISRYVNSGEPLDKAGAYGIQEGGVFLVDRIAGNIDNVIGLPRILLDKLALKLMEKKGFYGI